MNIRRFRALHDAGATYTEIAAEVGCDWRTVKKYLAPDAENAPPKAPSRRGTQPRRIDPYVAVVEGWLRADIDLLETTHRTLRAAVAELKPRDLDVTPRTSNVSHRALLTGIAAHDLYHAGQIQLLKRLGGKR